MSDWPRTKNVALGGAIINSASMCCGLGQMLRYFVTTNAHFGGGAVWPAANRAFYIPFYLEETVTAIQMAFEVTVQSGNYDAGIYDELGTRLVSVTSTAVPAAGLATPNIADTTLTPGTYFMALNVDNTTAAIGRISVPDNVSLRAAGVQTQDVGAVTLPNPATFANPAAAYAPGIAVVLAATV